MDATQFYEKVHGTSIDSCNLNKEAIVRLMDDYLAYHLSMKAQDFIDEANELISEKPKQSATLSHMASNRNPAVSTAGEFLNSEYPYSDHIK